MELFNENSLRLATVSQDAQRRMQLHEKSAGAANTRVFLSHSHLDRDLVEIARNLLKLHGSSIYVDWQDGEMPPVCSSATAAKLRAKIVSLPKFVLLASERSLNSRWVPWELGFADRAKTEANMAVLAIARENKDWTGSEYVGLYPIINAQAQVESSNGTRVSLSTWLDR